MTTTCLERSITRETIGPLVFVLRADNVGTPGRMYRHAAARAARRTGTWDVCFEGTHVESRIGVVAWSKASKEYTFVPRQSMRFGLEQLRAIAEFVERVGRKRGENPVAVSEVK